MSFYILHPCRCEEVCISVTPDKYLTCDQSNPVSPYFQMLETPNPIKNNNTVTNRLVAKRRLCKQRPVLGNARNIHAWKNRTRLCNPLLSNGSLNMRTTIGVLLETVFYSWSLQSSYQEEFSWESSVEFRNSKWAVSRDLGSAREAENMPLWVQLAVQLRQFSGVQLEFSRGVLSSG
jgi:hypothetical protein